MVDTLRADRLGAYGNTRGLTPFLDQRAAAGTMFRRAYAASSWTPPSVASLFTSRYPIQHRVVTSKAKLADAEVTLAEKFAAAHYATAGFSANLRLSEDLGFAQGFDVWVHHPGGPIKPRGSELRREALKWVDEGCAARRPAPCFLYLQYMEPHAPYQPPEPFRSRFGRTGPGVPDAGVANHKLLTLALSQISDAEVGVLESYYDAEVASVDDEIRRLFAELERRHFLSNAIVLITADHGEEFKDHDWMSHGTALYEETVRVPLILSAPGIEGGRVVDDDVSLVDVAPTLLDLAGLAPEPRFEGRSLTPLLRDPGVAAERAGTPSRKPPANDPPILLELLKTDMTVDLRRHTAGIVEGSSKLLMYQDVRTADTFDLSKDPHERAPMTIAANPAGKALALSLDSMEKELQKRAVATAEEKPLDAGTREKLRALGYGD